MTTTTAYPLVWDLDSLLPHPETEAFTSVLANFKSDLSALAERSDALPDVSTDAEVVAEWSRFLDDFATIDAQANDLVSHVGCHAAADAENRLFQQLEGQLAALDPLRTRVRTNVEFAVKTASEEELDAFVEASDALGRIAFFLRDCRANAAMRLPKEQELLAADLGVDGIHGWGRFYDRISGALKVRVMERGEVVEKSPSQVQFDMPERPVRENNFHAADRAWAGIADDCADALNHISGTRLSLYRRIGAQDHLDSPLRFNRMRRETLAAMWTAVSDRKTTLLKYLNAKANLIGVDRLAWYDLTAPLVSGAAAKAAAIFLHAGL